MSDGGAATIDLWSAIWRLSLHDLKRADFHTDVRAISSERGLDLAWRREVLKTSVRAMLSLAVTGREQR